MWARHGGVSAICRYAINHLKHAEIHANSSRMHPVGAPLAGALTCGSGISGFRQYAGQSCERVNTGQTQGQPLRNAINHLEHMEIHTNSPRIHPVGAALAAALTCGRGMAGFRQYVGQSCERVNTGQAQGQPLRNAINHLKHAEIHANSSRMHPVGAPPCGCPNMLWQSRTLAIFRNAGPLSGRRFEAARHPASPTPCSIASRLRNMSFSREPITAAARPIGQEGSPAPIVGS